MKRMTLADFEARYQADPDPWDYATSAYERAKYGATLAAAGPGPFEHALELGASIGVFSSLLAPRCRALTTIDAAPTAVDCARRRLGEASGVEVLEGSIPHDIPVGPFDLVVASEILYYLTRTELTATLERLRVEMAAGGRLVAVHWRPSGAERPLTADDVHEVLAELPWLRGITRGDTGDYRLDAMERV